METAEAVGRLLASAAAVAGGVLAVVREVRLRRAVRQATRAETAARERLLEDTIAARDRDLERCERQRVAAADELQRWHDFMGRVGGPVGRT